MDHIAILTQQPCGAWYHDGKHYGKLSKAVTELRRAIRRRTEIPPRFVYQPHNLAGKREVEKLLNTESTVSA